MKFKYIKHLIIVVFAGLLFSACDDKYEIPGAEPNHVMITNSFGGLENRTQINDTITLIDLSRGVTSRDWKFPDNVANVISSGTDKVTGQSVVKVSFLKSGVYNVQLSQNYAGNVWVNAKQLNVSSFDTLIKVTVLERVKADFTATRVKENTVLSNKNGALNEVTAGREVQFVQKCQGEPSTFNWIIENKTGFVKRMEGATIINKFSSFGDYKVTLRASSSLGADTIAFENYIKVVPSTDPVDLLAVQSVDKKIQLVFSRDMNNPATNNLSSISLAVTNGTKTIPMTVKSLSLKPNEANVVVIECNAEIYNSDKILVSYDASKGNLVTTDGMLATSFNSQQVNFIKPNILESTVFDYSFETSTKADWPYLWWGGVWGNYDLSLSTAQARSGKSSGLLVMKPAGGAIFGHKINGANATFPVKAGKTYEVGVWIYMVSLGDKTSIPDLRFYWSPSTDWGVGGAFFTETTPIGKWTYFSSQATFKETGNYNFMIRGWNEKNSQECKFYMDDISVSELELRP